MTKETPPDPTENDKDKMDQELPPWLDKMAVRLWLILILATASYFFINQQQGKGEEIPYSTFKEQVKNDRVEEITLQGNIIEGRYRGAFSSNQQEAIFYSQIPPVEDLDLIPLLEDHNVVVRVKADKTEVSTLLITMIPWLIFLGLIFYTSRNMQKMNFGAGGPFGRFTKSGARRHEVKEISISFADVAGMENTKKELTEIIDYLKQPQRFQKLGAKMPRGILMMGPPGTGKTLLAKATAGEANVPFFSITGSEFVEMFVGVGASRVRDMFQSAREAAPALIFIDEIDAVGRVRGTGLGGGNDEREQTLNQILAEMDGFSDKETIVVLAATNRPDVLDPALLRPGRFDRKVTLELPKKNARKDILEVHVRKVPLDKDVDLIQIAASTVGFSGADLANLVNEAALYAASHNRDNVNMQCFDRARDKIILGTEREKLQNPTEKKRIACHESGHAITAWFLPNADPIHRITIIPHGRALGVTEQQPTEDKFNYGQHYLEERICIMLGGRCAEKLIFDEVSSGAADDLKQATHLARQMISTWGMNKELGPVSFQQSEEHPFLGREIALPKNFSEHTAEIIDEEVMHLIRDLEEKTRTLLSNHKKSLELMMDKLIELETLGEADIKSVIQSSQIVAAK